MNILFITDNFPPEVNAPATRTYEHCKCWVELGANVTVITCAPNFPNGVVYEGYKNRLCSTEMVDGIKVVRVWSYITANAGTVPRILDYFSFSISSFWVSLFRKTDIIIATSPQFFTTWSAFLLSKFKRKIWIFELRDLWPESIRAVGAMKNVTVLNVLEKIELFLYRDADKVIPNTPAFKENLIRRGVDSEKIEVIPNGSNTTLYSPRPKNGELLNRLGLEGKFIAGYLGTHGMAHGLDFILNCAAELTDERIHFLFVGDGAVKKDLLWQKEEMGLKNVTFLDPVTKEQVPDYLSIFDISMVPLRKSDTFKTVIPSKIFEASAMNIPVLLGVEGQAREIVEQYNSGLCYEPENRKDFLNALQKMARNGNGEALQFSWKLAEDFNRDTMAEKMLNELKKVSISV